MSEIDLQRQINEIKSELANIRNFEQPCVSLINHSAVSTIVGWSSFTNKQILYKKIGNVVFTFFDLDGTGNNANSTFTLPYTMNSSLAYVHKTIITTSNLTTQIGTCIVVGGNIVCNLYMDILGTGWGIGVRKLARGQFFYHVA